MGSFARTFIPIGFAVVIGIANGYYAFNPAFREHQDSQLPLAKNNQQSSKAPEIKDESQQQSPKANSPPSR
ncbi:hypothetical protein F4821DRAFT_241570 [Hypoxylon rubiginosum]|uniref:Uncharacterized protein n=1 Tax=Hypoxylon rubiginosum TaxID=110542 RepID=A0ACC0CXQ4_9PEZI|nr:hypothetical protein F4821DRAFT_241570 [Hypoxylon rubiginosum]